MKYEKTTNIIDLYERFLRSEKITLAQMKEIYNISDKTAKRYISCLRNYFLRINVKERFGTVKIVYDRIEKAYYLVVEE